MNYGKLLHFPVALVTVAFAGFMLLLHVVEFLVAQYFFPSLLQYCYFSFYSIFLLFVTAAFVRTFGWHSQITTSLHIIPLDLTLVDVTHRRVHL